MSGLADLQALRDRVASLPEVRAKIAARAADAFGAIARSDFDAGVGVNGESFGKRADGKPMTLVKSGRLRADAIAYEAVGTRVRCTVGAVPYAKYQLKHGFLPGSGALPSAFEEAIEEIAQDEIAQHLGVSR